MLLGRAAERLALDRLLAEARDGRGGVLAIVGEPGIGKTSLLDHAEAAAGGAMRILRARGIDSEADVPFAGLAELLRPALGAMDRIPAPQAAALAGALALAPATAQDRFAIGAATLSLLSAFADDGPLLLLVDDAHRLDGSSAEALRFAARRLLADPVALVIAVREGEPSLLDGADLRTLRVAGLDRSDAATLLERSDVTGEGVERLYRATGGNPLALLELAPEAGRLTGLPEAAPVPISASIAAAFLRRYERLPDDTRRVLLLAAASDGGDLAPLARAVDSIGLAVAHLEAAEEAGLVALDGAVVEFAHPLARSAVYARATGPERRAAHAALAAALPDRDVDRRAWHLAAACVGPDQRACSALEQAGARAHARSAYAVAAGAFERAATLSPDQDARGRLLFAAADAAWLGGSPARTAGLLERARRHAGDPVTSARIDQLRGHMASRVGPLADAHPLLVAAAEAVAAHEPELAVVMLAEAVHACLYAGDTPRMIATAERAAALAAGLGSPRADFFAAMATGMALVADGQSKGAAEVRRAVAILEASDDLAGDPRLANWVVLGPLWLRESGAGRALIARASDRARRDAAIGVLPNILFHIARDQATSDEWTAAGVGYDEAIRLARETGQRTELGASLAGLAMLEARQGREAACREHAGEAAAVCEEIGAGLHAIWAIQALGDLELGLGRAAAAAAFHAEQASALRASAIADVDLSPVPELVEAHMRLGSPEHAAAAVGDFLALAEAKGQPWALARAARCRALLAGPGASDGFFEQARALHALTPDAFEAARTELAHGARLRREGHRVRAREPLRAALATFDRLGAQPWADQAGTELAATGETARRRDPSTLDDLTPQELQITRLLAGGMTTREAAAAVFLSPKTVEYHLRNAYRKLGIRSREELERIVGVARQRGS